MNASNVERARSILLSLAADKLSAGEMADIITNSAVMCADTMAAAVPEIGGDLNALALLIQRIIERHGETRDLEAEIHVISNDDGEVH